MTRTSLPWMESVDAKFARSRQHLWSLNHDLTELGRSFKLTMFVKVDEESALLRTINQSVYTDLSQSILFGEFLHNLRSSLDAAVFGLIKRHGGTPHKDAGFPIWSSEEYFNNHTIVGRPSDVLAGVPDQARRVIKELQPFQRGPKGMELDPLFQLNAMYNEDKHQASHIMLGFSKDTRFRVHTLDGPVDIYSREPLIGHGPWDFHIPVRASRLGAEPRVEATGTTEFLIRTDRPWQGRPILDFANNCVRYVEDLVFPRLRPFFE